MSGRASQSPIARAKAVEALRTLRIEAAEEIDVDAIAFRYGLRVRHGGLRGARGRLVPSASGAKGIVRVGEDANTEEQRRFVIAHELGHHLLHVSRGKTSVCLEGDFVRYGDVDNETDANRFAAELLMPQKLFEPHCDVKTPSFKHIEKLALVFKTTFTSAAIRFVDLCPEACALVWSEKRAVVWSIAGDGFFGWIERGRPLDSDTHAYDAFGTGQGTRRPELVDGSAWADRLPENIYEDTRWFGGLQATLSLLWAPS